MPQAKAAPASDAAHRPHRRARLWSLGLAIAVMLLSFEILVFGWGLHIDSQATYLPNLPKMVPATALNFLILSVAHLLGNGRHRKAARPFVLSLTALSALIVMSLLALGIGPLTQTYQVILPHGVRPADGMSISTSFGLLLLAACLALSHLKRPWASDLAGYAATVGLILSVLSMMGHAFDLDNFYRFLIVAQMSVLTTTSLLFMFAAVLLTMPRWRWMQLIFGPGRGSQSARRLLPLALISPLALAFFLLSFETTVLSEKLRIALLAYTLLLMGSITVFQIASSGNRDEVRARAESQRLRNVLRRIPAAVFALNAQGRLMFSNHAADLLAGGKSAAEDWLNTMSLHDLATHRQLEAAARPTARLARGEPLRGLNLGHMTAAGAEQILSFTSSVTDEEKGPLTLLVVQDITDSWRLRETLAHSERSEIVGEIAGGIAHDINNVLGAIQLTADAAAMNEKADPLRPALEAIRTACARGTTLTDRILNLQRFDQDEAHPVDLKTHLDSAVALARASLPQEVTLDYRPPREGAQVMLTDADLDTALLNLILNASNAMTEAGTSAPRILVEVVHGPGDHRLRVTDNGPGMSKAVLRNATRPFFSTRIGRGGTGLGLPMVERFAQSAGGDLWLASRSGVGTRATLRLPDAQRGAAPARSAASQEIERLTGMRIMVVDDDPLHGSALVFGLEAAGATTAHFDAADTALKAMREQAAPDILLTDIMLPGLLNGYALAEQARKIWADLPIIYLTGYADAPTREQQKVPGLVLNKPININHLANAIHLSRGTTPRD